MPKTALVGLGRWGLRVAEALALSSDFQGYASRTEPTTAEKPRFPRMELSELMSRDDIPAVWVATPISTHYEIAKKLLSAGKHVMVEKPLAARVQEAEELARIAQSRGVLLSTGYVFLFDPAFEALKRELENRKITRVEIHWHKYGTFEETLEKNLLTHHLAMMLSLFGEPREARVLSREAVESACDRMTSEYDYDGFTVTSEINRASMEPEHTIVVSCNDATEWHWSGGTLKKREGDGQKQAYFKSGEMPLNREVTAWIDALTKHTTLPTQNDFGARVLKLQEKVDAYSASRG